MDSGADRGRTTLSALHFRRARRDECAALTRIAHAAKRHWGYPEEWIRLWTEDLTVTPARIARDLTYCAVTGTRLVGFGAVSGTGAERELEHLWIDPPYIGRGIGRALLAHLGAVAQRDGARRLRIAADPHAATFYRRLGAREIGEVASRPAGRTLPLFELQI